jgi:hypothetical protein
LQAGVEPVIQWAIVHFSFKWMSLLCLVLVHSVLASDSGYSIPKVNHELLDELGNATDEVGNYVSKARYQRQLLESSRAMGVRFHIQWRAPISKASKFKVQLDVRARNAATQKETVQTFTKEYPPNSNFSGWAVMDIKDQAYQQLGKVMAWKVTLLYGAEPMATRQSFLWDDSFLTSPESKEQEKETEKNETSKSQQDEI